MTKSRLNEVELDEETSALIQGLLIRLCELDEVERAPQILMPHIASIMKANVTKEVENLELSLAQAALLDDDGVASLYAAADYIICFVEEIALQANQMNRDHQGLLRVIGLPFVRS